ncbi:MULTISPECIES: S8 family peptidase [Shewanella]|uniref:S8 family peptidase n=1 Tax=Shewanella xiamenensis TaxID=332186 RepID=A0ABT6UFJ9_9GAMM|nr:MULTISPECIES: S8 family peptidase [Shewanella]MBW0279494.1 hypothetical protein [Shewanella xiamenensis]MCU8014714.1 S8 family peptidase [Shewanella sp. SM74]MDI5833248.1 S8 family peptidase [Shewanella xiamenensis]
MDMKPILTFNKPKTDGIRGKLQGRGGAPITPGVGAQAARIIPKVERLEKHFAEHIQLSYSPEGMQPERVLVLEVAGDVQNLADALAKVQGFELLAQHIVDRDFKDDNFYIEKNGKIKSVVKNAYLAMSNQAGLHKLLAMWKRYVATGQIDAGFTPLRDAFLQLADIRFWDTKDRLESTYILEDWQHKLQDAELGFDESIPFEIELWYRPTGFLRGQAEGHIRSVVLGCGGSISKSFVHDGIGYHGLLGLLPLSKVRDVVESSGAALELMRCDEVMFFRPLGQCITPKIITAEEQLITDSERFEGPSPGYQQPVVALLDGLPLSNHNALKGMLIIDDADDLEQFYQSPSEQVHGTAMASIIIHGDLNNRQERPLELPLYVRPILAPEHTQMDGTRLEQIPSAYLPIDLVHRAVIRMKEGEGGLPPTAPNVVIINLSVGDPYRLFDTQMSPWARMLDWLSIRYGVLFVVSAGNMTQRICLDGIKEHDFKSLTPEELEERTLKAIAKQKHERRMMSPAEAINAITVKSSHQDRFEGAIPVNQVDVFTTPGLFSPISPVTLGKKNSVKPELLMPGGRQTYINKTMLVNEDVVLDVARSVRFGPGVKTALPASSPGALNTYGFTTGTSNAAALATRRLAFLYETLISIKEFGDQQALSYASDALILKALLAHGAEHMEQATEVIEQLLKTKENNRTFKSELNQYLGFGVVNESRIHACQNNQATLIYTGVIRDGAAHEYRLPLPPCLAAETVNRRLIVTVAWFSPVNHGHQDYRGAQLWATPAHKVINADNGDYYHHHLKNGTIFHEVRKGDKAASFTEGDFLAIQVHCNGRAGYEGIDVPYALVVTLDTPGSDLPIYEEVKLGLNIEVEQTV